MQIKVDGQLLFYKRGKSEHYRIRMPVNCRTRWLDGKCNRK